MLGVSNYTNLTTFLISLFILSGFDKTDSL